MKKLTAYDELQRFGAMFKGIMEVAEELKDVGGLEQAAAEAKAAKERELAEIEGLKLEKDKLKKQTEATRNKVEQLVADSAAELLAAQQKIAQEWVEHNERVVVLQRQARAELIAVEEQINQAKANVQAQAAVEQARQQAMLDDLGSRTKAAQDELSDIETKLDKARKALAKLGLVVAE